MQIMPKSDRHAGPSASAPPTRPHAQTPIDAGAQVTCLGSFDPPTDAPTVTTLAAPVSVVNRGSKKWQERLHRPDSYDKVALRGSGKGPKNHRLGEGVAGTVKLARHRDTGAYVAIKKLPLGSTRTGEREITAAAQIDSPYVVKPFFYQQTFNRLGEPGKAYLLSPLVDGVTVASSEERSGAILLRALLHIFSGLEKIHEAKLIHGDMRNGANMMIDRGGVGRIIDLGNSRDLDTDDQALKDFTDTLNAFQLKLRLRVDSRALADFGQWLKQLLANRRQLF